LPVAPDAPALGALTAGPPCCRHPDGAGL